MKGAIIITISTQAEAELIRLMRTGFYGKTKHETATILLLEKLREIQAKEKP